MYKEIILVSVICHSDFSVGGRHAAH